MKIILVPNKLNNQKARHTKMMELACLTEQLTFQTVQLHTHRQYHPNKVYLLGLLF